MLSSGPSKKASQNRRSTQDAPLSEESPQKEEGWGGGGGLENKRHVWERPNGAPFCGAGSSAERLVSCQTFIEHWLCTGDVLGARVKVEDT